MFDQLNRLPTADEMEVWKRTFAALCDELSQLKLIACKGFTVQRRVLVYFLHANHVERAQDVTAQQWEDWFTSIDRIRDLRELPALVQYIESLSAPPAPSNAPLFSAADLLILIDAGVSAQDDSRVPSKYWKAKG